MAGSEEEGDFPDPPPPRRGKHPEGIKPATAATLAEAQEAYRKDPKSVHRSKNDSLHWQYWRIDPGSGGLPPIYKSGNTFIIAPNLVGPGLPPPHAEPIEADEGAESANVRAMGEHLDARLRAKSSIPSAAPAPGNPPPRQTPGMAYGPTLDSSGGVATAPTVPGPSSDPRRSSGMAHGPTLDAAGGVATAQTQPGARPSSDAAGPAAAPAPAAAVPGSAGQQPAPGFVPPSSPTNVGSAEEGDFDDAASAPRRNRPAGIKPAAAATLVEAQEAYRRDPNSVHRSTNDSVHRQHWQIDPGSGGLPPIYKSGNTFIIAPHLTGPGLPPPHAETIEADEGAESANVRAMGEHLDARLRAKSSIPSAAPAPSNSGSSAPSEEAQPDIKLPGAPGGPTGGPKQGHTQPADTAATSTDPVQDVRARRVEEGLKDMGARYAARAERMKVERIEDPDVAARMFVEGKGAAGGNVPMTRRLYEDQWRHTHHQLTDPPAAGWRKADGTVVVDSSNPRVREAVERLARERKAAPTAPAPQQPHVATGPVPAPAPVGKNAGAPQTGQASASPQPSVPGQASASNGPDTGPSSQSQPPKRPKIAAGVDVNLNQAKVAVKLGPPAPPVSTGADAQKPKTAPSVQVSVSPKEVGANVEVMRPTAGGGQHGATAGGSYELNTGNTQATAGYKVATKGGSGGSVALTGGNSVTVDDPEEVQEGVWIVSYVISDSSGIAAGGTVKAGPIEGGVSGSETKAKLRTGSRKFNTESEADKFKKNIRDELAGESYRQIYFPPTTAGGALMIPPGESRGAGASDTVAGSISGGAATGSFAKSGYKSSTHMLSVYHAAGFKVQVTTTVSTEKGSAWTASGLGLSNESGGSESALYAVTFEFDLSNPADERAFETFCKRPVPFADGRIPHSLRKLTTQEDHDKYNLAGGESKMSGDISHETIVDAQGEHDKHTGRQIEDHTPGRILGLFEDEKHASAEIVSSLENGKESGFAAKMKVSGESGDFNRRQFGKIFPGAKFSGDAEASGKWTLTSAIPKEAVHALERDSPAFRNAKTQDEKLTIYSALVKKNGAQMLGGQAGITSLSWNLELKGNDNFPGERGRAKLNDLRQRLAAQLKDKPDTAYTVAREAKETLENLDKRFTAVSDKRQFTDLPDGLREEQLQVIRMHRSEFIQLRQRALSVAGQHDPNEKIEDVEKRATSGAGYKDIDPNDRDRVKLQDSMTLSDDAIQKNRVAIWSASKAIGQVRTSPDVIQFDDRVDKQKMLTMTASVEGKISEAFALQRQGNALEAQVKLLREKFDHEVDPEPRLRAMRPLEQKLREHSAVLTEQHEKLVEIGRDLYPVARFSAMERKPGRAFWLSVSSARDEEPEQTSMALP